MVADSIGLGMTRLSIIDLAGGHQPIYNEDGTVAVVFNGEIYNYRELRDQLQRKGHRFSTRSDTEVIVHAYEDDDDECVTRFNGIFAFALWDFERRRLLMSRDRAGVKPLYYVQRGEGLAFASEIKALLTLPGVDRSADLEATAVIGEISTGTVGAPPTRRARRAARAPGACSTGSRWRRPGPGHRPCPGSRARTRPGPASRRAARSWSRSSGRPCGIR